VTFPFSVTHPFTDRFRALGPIAVGVQAETDALAMTDVALNVSNWDE